MECTMGKAETFSVDFYYWRSYKTSHGLIIECFLSSRPGFPKSNGAMAETWNSESQPLFEICGQTPDFCHSSVAPRQVPRTKKKMVRNRFLSKFRAEQTLKEYV